MFQKVFFQIWCFSLITLVTQAQKSAPVFKHITVSDGLPSSTVHFTIQDNKGYMWFATDHGVARYNGYEFKVFTSKDGLEDNTVFNLFEDVKGRMWMLTFSGKIFYYSNGKITPCQFNKKITDYIKGAIPTEIYADSVDNIYMAFQNRCEIKIDRNGNLQKVMEFDKKLNGALLIHEIDESKMFTSVEGSNTYLNPLIVFLKKGNHIDSLFLSTYISPRFSAIRLDTDNLIFSIFPDLYLYSNNKVKRIAANGLPQIIKFFKNKNGNAIACTTHGLLVFNNILASSDWITYLPDEVVTSCFEDHENGIWITTRDNGVYYLPNSAIQCFFTKDKYFEKPICFTTDLKNTIYTGYWSGQVTTIANSEQRNLYKNQSASPAYSLYLDSLMNLYVSSEPAVILKSNKITTLINRWNKNVGIAGLKNNFVLHHDGFLYNAAQSSLRKIGKNTIVERIEINHRINCLYETKQNQLLIGCKNGVYSLIDSSKKVIPYIIEIENISIEDIKQFHNHICFATQGAGLYFFNGNNNFVINETNGLVSDLTNRIFVHENNVWCATNKGISHINFTDKNKLTYNIRNITTKEGLPSNEINDITFLNDTMWVATNSGVCFFESKHKFTNEIAPTVYITSIRINGVNSINQKNFTLPHDSNNLKISFEGISYKSQTDIMYRYVLTSGKDSVSGLTKTRDVDLLSLNAGNYIFIVWAKNSAGIWSKNGAALSFTIHPAWWHTWWFRALIFGLIALAVYLYYRRRLKRLHDQFDADRTRAALQLTALRAQMNPHFIFNVMNSIRNYIQKSDIIAAQKYLTSFSKLIRYTLDNSQEQEISLQEEINALQVYAELEMLRFENAFDFIINCDHEINMDETMIPSLLLQPFVENSIKHGIARIEAKGKILIKINKSKNNILITIEDNGAGREHSNTINESNHEKHVSHGTSLTINRMASYNKAYNRNITVQIIDLKDENGRASGSRVEIWI